MPIKQPYDSQFEVVRLLVVHAPTGARFSFYSSGAQRSVNWGRAGELLPNGDDYARGDVEATAVRLHGKRFGRALSNPFDA